MPRRFVPALLVAVAALALPAAASAAVTWTVDADSPGTINDDCNGDTHVCKTITKAAEAVHNGDTIIIKDGTYAEPTIVFKKADLIVKAEHPGKVSITSSSTTAGDPVIQIGSTNFVGIGCPLPVLCTEEATNDAPRLHLEGVTISVQPNGGQAVRIVGHGTEIVNSTLARITASSDPDADHPVVEVDPLILDGTTTLIGCQIVQTTGSMGAVVVGDNAGALQIADSFIVASTGPGVRMSDIDDEGTNLIFRSQIFALDAAADALRLDAVGNTGGDKELGLDSVVLSAGQNGAGLRATTTAANTGIVINAVHATIAGSLRGVILDGAAGAIRITATFDKSILHGQNILVQPDADPPSEVVMDIGHSDTDQAAAADITVHSNTNTAPDKLFADVIHRNFHLRADATAAIDTVDGPVAQSETDIDGDPRVSGPRADKGADEFVNHAPVAALAASTTSTRQNSPVSFDASQSSDPDVGGGIVRYDWNFGDGTTAQTATPFVSHSFAEIGVYSVTVSASDALGASSAPSPAIAIKVTDGIPPTVRINAPKPNQTFKIFKRKVTKRKTLVLVNGETVSKTVRTVTKVRNRFRFFGSAADANGIHGVQIAIRRVKLATKTARTSAVAGCVFFGKSGFIKLPCTKPRFFNVSVKDGLWAYRTKSSTRFRAGTYQLIVRATDTNGVVSANEVVTFFMK